MPHICLDQKLLCKDASDIVTAERRGRIDERNFSEICYEKHQMRKVNRINKSCAQFVAEPAVDEVKDVILKIKNDRVPKFELFKYRDDAQCS